MYTVYFRCSGRHLGIITSGYFRRRLQYVQRVERPRKFTGSRWNFDDTIVCTSGLATAILELLLPVTSDDVGNRDFMSGELSDPGNTGVAVGISTLQWSASLHMVNFRFIGRHLGFWTSGSSAM